MTLTTTNYAFPYPQSSDPPNGPSQMGALASAVDTSLNTVAGYVGSWLTWGPTYTGFNAGNGTVEALYKQDISKTGSKTIHFEWRVVFCTTPTLTTFAAPRGGGQCPSGGRAGTEMNHPPTPLAGRALPGIGTAWR